MKRRIVITGMGLLSPAGNTTAENWYRILEGTPRAGKVKSFPIGEMPCQIAYEIEDFSLNPWIQDKLDLRFASRFTQFGLQAAAEALDNAGLAPQSNTIPELAIVLGNGMGSPSFKWFSDIYVDGQFADEQVCDSHSNKPDRLSHYLKQLTGAEGGVKTVHTACASSGQALGEAFEMIASGESDIVLTGGADSMINPFHMAGFCLLGALSQRNDDPNTASRPFDEDRNGFVLGEGAAMLVFEEYEHARARGANIIAEVCGYGVSESAYRITDLHPEGQGPIEAMKMALASANLQAHEIGYINAHGTSTLLNDRIESLAIHKVFNDHAYVNSTKSMTGHMISAAGAMEFAITSLAIHHQVLPPSANLFNQDRNCLIRTTPSTVIEAPLRYGLSNSVGFGGSNTALIAGRI